MRSDKEIYFEEIDSTNNYLKENFNKLENLTFIRTDFQTSGRGQFLRNWESGKDENILFSILLKNISIKKLELIKELTTKTLINYLKKYKINSKFVYPNDIYVKDKKILGILIETKVLNSDLEYIVIGIGININQAKFNSKDATSFKLLNKKSYDIKELYKILIGDFKIAFKEIGVY